MRDYDGCSHCSIDVLPEVTAQLTASEAARADLGKRLAAAQQKLQRYRNTGLEPEQVIELKSFTQGGIHKVDDGWKHVQDLLQAEQDGRLVVLPCKVGDVVYGFHQERTILPMVAKWIETDTDGWTVAAQYVPMAPKFYLFSDFGKTAFLTREEAEAALAEKGVTK